MQSTSTCRAKVKFHFQISGGIAFPERRRNPIVRLVEGQVKVKAFEASKYSMLGKKGSKAQKKEHNSHWITYRGKIWIIEIHVQACRRVHERNRSQPLDLIA
jgi:hypothetical protein